MLIVPLQSVPSQIVSPLLANQDCKIAVYQKSTSMYVDLYVDDALIVGGVAAQNRNRVVRNVYLGFDGDLVFIDTQGSDDPSYQELGTRFVLAYITEEEAAAVAARQDP